MLYRSSMSKAVRVKRVCTRDSEGNVLSSWKESDSFLAAVVPVGASTSDITGAERYKRKYKVYTPPDVKLKCGDIFKLWDGKAYKITSDGEGYLPESANISFRLMKAEEFSLKGLTEEVEA